MVEELLSEAEKEGKNNKNLKKFKSKLRLFQKQRNNPSQKRNKQI